MSLQKKQKPQAPLAMRDGVAPSRVWLPAGPWRTVGEFLLERFQYLDAQGIGERVERGDVVNSGGEAQSMDMPYRPEQWLWYYREVQDEVAVPFDMPILHADERLIAVDKPHFLATVPTGRYLKETALTRLRAQFQNPDITPLHRLDRDTAGVLLFCVQPDYRGVYQQLFQTQEVFKEYEAVAPALDQTMPLVKRSCIEAPHGEFMVREVEGEANSETHIAVLAKWFDQQSQEWLMHYQLRPITGRKHQLRLHMSSLGSPIVNDAFYPIWHKDRDPSDYSRPLQLLARRIAFTDPVDGQKRDYRSQRTLAWITPSSVK